MKNKIITSIHAKFVNANIKLLIICVLTGLFFMQQQVNAQCPTTNCLTVDNQLTDNVELKFDGFAAVFSISGGTSIDIDLTGGAFSGSPITTNVWVRRTSFPCSVPPYPASLLVIFSTSPSGGFLMSSSSNYCLSSSTDPYDWTTNYTGNPDRNYTLVIY